MKLVSAYDSTAVWQVFQGSNKFAAVVLQIELV